MSIHNVLWQTWTSSRAKSFKAHFYYRSPIVCGEISGLLTFSISVFYCDKRCVDEVQHNIVSYWLHTIQVILNLSPQRRHGIRVWFLDVDAGSLNLPFTCREFWTNFNNKNNWISSTPRFSQVYYYVKHHNACILPEHLNNFWILIVINLTFWIFHHDLCEQQHILNIGNM